MLNLSCPYPTQFDKKVAELTQRDPYAVAIIRDFYERNNEGSKVTTLDDFREAQQYYLRKEKENRDNQVAKAIIDSSKPSNTTISDIFTVSEWKAAVNGLAFCCSKLVDILHSNHPEFSREQILNGVKDAEGNNIGGIINILYEVISNNNNVVRDGNGTNISLAYKIQRAMEELQKVKESGSEEQIKEATYLLETLLKVNSNISLLVPLILKRLAITEGIKVNDKMEYAVASSISDFRDNSGTLINFEADESTKDRWQEVANSVPIIAKATAKVKLLLTRIPLTDKDGKIVKNILGWPECMEPDNALNLFKEATEGCSSVEEMFEDLNKLSAEYSLYKKEEYDGKRGYNPIRSIIKLLENDRQLASEFYKTVHYGTTLYGSISRKSKFGVREGTASILNSISRKARMQRFIASVKSTKQLVEGSIFKKDEKGETIFSHNNFQKFKSKILDVYFNIDENGDTEFSKLFHNIYSDTSAKSKCEEILFETLLTLGVFEVNNQKANKNSISKILKDRVLLSKLISELTNLQKNYSHINIRKDITKIEDVLSAEVGSTHNYLGYVLQSIDSIASSTLRNQFSGQVRYAGNLRISATVPCFLTDFVGTAKRFLRYNPKEIRSYLEKRYGVVRDESGKVISYNPIICEVGGWDKQNANGDPLPGAKQTIRFKNRLLEDLCRNSTNPDSYLSNIKHIKILGDRDGTEVENFNEVDILTTMLSYFSSKRGPMSKKFAEYPVFILGDSNSFETLTGPKYTSGEIKAGYYEIFQQELERIAQSISFRQNLERKGFKRNKEYSKGSYNFSWIHCLEFNTNEDGLFVDLNGNELQYYDLNGNLTEDPKFKTKDGQMNNWSNFKENIGVTIKINGQESIVVPLSNLMDRAAFIESIIEPYLNSRYREFITNCESVGLLDTIESPGKFKYKYLNSIADVKSGQDPNEAVEHFLKDFYYNYCYNAIQQVQITTIDPSFCSSSKLFQKRNKQIHASGTTIDLTLTDEKYCDIKSEDYGKSLFEKLNRYTGETKVGYQTALYYDDILVNSEETDPEFMKVQILENLKDKSEENIQAVKQELTELVTPLQNKQENEARLNRIKELLTPSGFIRYNKFRECTLTDGQSHRTLKSYRAISIATGNWDEIKEGAYRKIQEIRRSIRNRGTGVTEEEINELNQYRAMFQPLKPFYYFNEEVPLYDKERNQVPSVVQNPTQHKCSEAVLIPELMAEGKLKDIAIYMEEHDIDVLCSSEVIKIGCFGSIDISSDNKEDLIKSLDSGYVHFLSLEGYKIQNNITEHYDEEELIPTQERKMFFGGIKFNKDYSNYVGGSQVNIGGKTVNLNGSNLIKFYNQVICTLMGRNFERWEGLTDTRASRSRLLINSIMSSNRLGASLIEDFKVDENGEYNMPINEGSVDYSSSTTLLSKFKKIVNKLFSTGTTHVHESCLGCNGYEVDSNLKIEVDNNNIIWYQAEAAWDEFIEDTNGNIVELEFSEYCNADGSLKVNKDGIPLLDIDYPHQRERTITRVPVEAPYSIVNIKVVKYRPRICGMTMRLPPQITVVLGLDYDSDKGKEKRYKYKLRDLKDSEVEKVWKLFYDKHEDIKDKLLIARDAESLKGNQVKDRLYKYWAEAGLPGTSKQAFTDFCKELDMHIEFEEYDINKPAYEQTKTALENMYLRLMQSRMKDPETLSRRAVPGGFQDAKDAARIMREIFFKLSGKKSYSEVRKNALNPKNADPEPNYYIEDPITWLRYNNLNQIASKLIGIFANYNTNHALMNTFDKFELSRPIIFGSLIEAVAERDEVDIKGNPIKTKLPLGQSMLASRLIKKSSLITDPSDILSQLLSSSVDAVKDPILNYLGINAITANFACLLASLGYDFEDMGLLFNQPVVKFVCDYCISHGTSNIIKGIQAAKAEDTFWNKNITPSKEPLTQEELYKGLASSTLDIQSRVLSLIEQMVEPSSALSSLVSDTKFTASNAFSTNWGDIYSRLMKIERVFREANEQDEDNSPVIIVQPFNSDEALKSIIYPTNEGISKGNISYKEYIRSLAENPIAFEQLQYDVMNITAKKLAAKDYQYETDAFKTVRKVLESLNPTFTPTGDSINSLHRAFTVFIMENMRYGFNKLSSTIRKTVIGKDVDDVPASDYYTYLFPSYLRDFIHNPKNLEITERFPFLKENLEFRNEQLPNGTPYTSVRFLNISDLNDTELEELKSQWEALAELGYSLGGDNVYTSISEGLFYYNLFKYGNDFGYASFNNLCPSIVKDHIQVCTEGEGTSPISYKEFYKLITDNNFLNRIVSTGSITYRAFISRWLINNMSYTNTTEITSSSDKTLIQNRLDKNNGLGFELTSTDIEILDCGLYLIKYKGSNTKTEKETKWSPIIVLNDKVYIASNTDSNSINGGDSCVYRLVKGSLLPRGVEVNSYGIKESSYMYPSGVFGWESDFYAYQESDGETGLYIPSILAGTQDITPGKLFDIRDVIGEDKINKAIEALIWNTGISSEEARETIESILVSIRDNSNLEYMSQNDIEEAFNQAYNEALKKSDRECRKEMKSEDPMCS